MLLGISLILLLLLYSFTLIFDLQAYGYCLFIYHQCIH